MAGQENNAEDNQQQEQQAVAAEATPSTAAAPGAPQRVTSAHKRDFEKDVVYLYQFCRSGISPSVSPFCLKVETWLRMAGIKYENVDHKLKLKSKKGQVPFVELNGEEIADSTIIIRELGKHFNKDLDSRLSPEQRNLSHALSAMTEHHTSWACRWWRYNNPGAFVKEAKLNIQQAMQTRIPVSILNFVFKMKLKGKKSAPIAQGIGVHKPEEIYEFVQRDFEVLNNVLGDKHYFFGDEPSTLDSLVFCHLLQFLAGSGDKFPPKVYLEEKCPKLVAYVERIKERYFPDWEEMCTTRDLNTHLPKPVAEAKPDNDEKKEEDKEKLKEKDEDGEKEKTDNIEKEKEQKEEDANKLEEKAKEEQKQEEK